MKKFFGWFFIIAGIGNFLRILGLASSNGDNQIIGNIFFMAIGFVGLGIYLLRSNN